MIYIMVFFLSIMFAVLACKTKNKYIRIICSALCIFLPAFLGGCRNFEIGTDTQNYIWIYCDSVHRVKNIFEYVFLWHGGKEPLFSMLVYVIMKIFDSENMVLFVEELLIMVCIYIGLYKHKEKCSMFLGLLIFYCLYYNASYNVTRQYLAMAILFLGLDTLEQKQYKKYLMYIIVATLIHSSAIVAILLLLIKYYLVEHRDRKLLSVIFLGIEGVLLLEFSSIVNILIKIGLVSERYAVYMNRANSVTANFLTVILLMVYFFVTIFSCSKNNQNVSWLFYRKCLVLEIVLLWGTRSIYFGHRIATYFSLTDILLISSIPKYMKTRIQRIIVSLVVVCLFLFYWYRVSVSGNSGETFPYRSDILGI